MISEQRLKELIAQHGKVYQLCGNRIYVENLNDSHFVGISDDELSLKQRYNGHEEDLIDYARCLFETREAAEWHIEFGNIERTDTLNLPSPDKLDGYSSFATYFLNPLGKAYKLLVNFPCNYIGLFEVDKQDVKLLKSATLENYTLACRKAKQIFLGDCV